MARIVFVNTRYRPPYFRGGVERYVHVLGEAFRSLGHKAEVVAFAEDLPCESDVPHHFIAPARIPFLTPLLFSWKGRRLWREADLIVLQYAPLGLLMPANKLICTVHTTGYGEAAALQQMRKTGMAAWWKGARRWISLPFERRVYRRARKIIAISEQIAAELIDAYGIASDRISVIGNGVDCRQFQPDAAAKGRAPPHVLYVGRLAPRKNVDVLVRAVALCKSQPQLRIVGAGPELSRIQFLVDSLGIGGSVHFRGFRTGSDLLAEYHWADLLVMPSSYEGVPLVALEAKAAGVPIVAADFPGAANLVTGLSGQVVSNVSPDTLALAIDELAGDQPRLNRMAESTRREAIDKFSWDAVVGALAAQYETVLRQARCGADVHPS